MPVTFRKKSQPPVKAGFHADLSHTAPKMKKTLTKIVGPVDGQKNNVVIKRKFSTDPPPGYRVMGGYPTKTGTATRYINQKGDSLIDRATSKDGSRQTSFKFLNPHFKKQP